MRHYYLVPFLSLLFISGVAQAQSKQLNDMIADAERGDPLAQMFLGKAYYNAEFGAKRDFVAAAKWYKASAKQGEVSAQADLALMYLDGQGVPRDNILAYMWMNVAAGNDNMLANPSRFLLDDLIAPLLGQDEIAYAQKLSSICVESGYQRCGH